MSPLGDFCQTLVIAAEAAIQTADRVWKSGVSAWNGML